MKEYSAELDGIKGFRTGWYTTDDETELISWVTEDLELLGGGHADIFDEEGEFVEDVEV